MLLAAGCQKNFSDFYDRPAGLGAPIYQQLQERGNFKQLLAAIDKAGYKEILSNTGWWTFFAPTDAAFEKFYVENNINGIEGLSDSMAVAIVKYALVYNSYRDDQLSIYQQAGGGVDGKAFKRKTAYYDWVQQHGDDRYSKIIATNRNVSSRRSGSSSVNVSNYKDGDNNNKYIPYFTTSFFNSNGLSGEDYQAFFPNTPFSGFNVAGAKVEEKNIAAENGTIHIIDQVIPPLKNLEQYIYSKPQYSGFAKLLDSMRYYTANAYVTQKNLIATGSSDSVYVSGYDGRLAFSPNNENYQQPGLTSFFMTEAQSQSWSMMVPDNEALAAYRAKILAKYGNTFFGNTPASILVDFLNSHMWPEALWPSQFKIKDNFLLEETTIELDNAVDKQVLSNGIFYGVNKANEANVFRTVFGVPYLDPEARMTFYGFSDLSTGIKAYVLQPTVRQTVLLTPDNVLEAAGWRYNDANAQPWGYKSASSSSYSHNNIYGENMRHIMTTGLLLTPQNEILDFSGEGIVETKNGDYIKYKNGKIQTSGTMDAGTELSITKSDVTSVNGVVHYLDGVLSFTEKNVGQHIENLAAEYPSKYSSFFWFLSNSNVYNKSTKAISNVLTSLDNKYTILVPDNNAIAQAIKDGLLPGNKTTGALPTSAPTNQEQVDLVRKFILYHIINGETVAADGKKSDNFLTLYQTEDGTGTLVSVLNEPGNMVITDRTLRAAVVSPAESNQLSNRALIHSINNYLNYNK